jgi:uncharacterized membrane protein
MSKELQLIAAVYLDQERATTILDMLEQMHRANTITVVDLASVEKGEDGKLKIVETREVTAKKGAKRGAIAAGIFGLIFPPSLIASALVGAAVGGAWGKLRDTGLKSSSIEELGQSLEPGKAAVIVLVPPESVQATERALQGYDGQLVTHTFSAAESEQIQAASSEAATPSG